MRASLQQYHFSLLTCASLLCTSQRVTPDFFIYNQIHVKICKENFTKKAEIHVVFLHKFRLQLLSFPVFFISRIFFLQSSDRCILICDDTSHNHPRAALRKSYPQPPCELSGRKYHFHIEAVYLMSK